eukprot:TRINITY_DN7067_c0_g1_i1.p1 TRINITY_DN7067_c0_g1~~TRINITY_DN7067_c0_g1_i1.p1  ORF type:complete len:641 (-),score=125.43 TRINITY_DN7067_c0_g1_i1:78-2000(-)
MLSDPYIVLSVDRNASDLEVRSAYRRRALETHPDKGGTAESFRQVVEAFEILSDRVRRAAFEQAERNARQSADAPNKSDAKKRHPEHEPAWDISSRRTSQSRPPKRAKKDRAPGMSSRPSTAAAQAKDGKNSVPTVPIHATPTAAPADNAKESHAGKPSFVARIVQDLLNVVLTSWTERLDELPDETLVEVEAFLREGDCVDDNGGDFPHEGLGVSGKTTPDAKGAGSVNAEGGMESCILREEAEDQEQKEDCELDQADESEGTVSAINFSGESTSALLAIKGWDEEDVANGDSFSDTEFASCHDDCTQEPQSLAMEAAEFIGGAAFSEVSGGTIIAGPHATGDHRTTSTGCVEGAWATASGLPSPRCASGESKLKGVEKNQSGSYRARVNIHCVTFLSKSCRDLNKAIDIHIFFVHVRQVIIAKMQEGVDFPDALREVDALITAECSKLDFRMSYVVRYVGMGRSVASSNVDQAIAVWKDKIQEKQRKRLERRQEAANRRVAAREQRQSGLIKRKQRLAARDAVKRQMQRQRLLACVRRVLGKRERRREKGLLDRWGVRTLPENVEQASLFCNGDSVCAVLRQSDGSSRQGPPRQCLKEAEMDAMDFARLQRRLGDVAACAELERREVAAMTAHFLELA